MIKKIKKAFTLLELTVTLAVCSVMLGMITLFMVFFDNQYKINKEISNGYMSAETLKSSIVNVIDRYNYAFSDINNYNSFNAISGEYMFGFWVSDPTQYGNYFKRIYYFKDNKLLYDEYRSSWIHEFDVYETLSDMWIKTNYDSTSKKCTFTITYNGDQELIFDKYMYKETD